LFMKKLTREVSADVLFPNRTVRSIEQS